ncbi:MAG: hypothetical protein JXR77_13530, partial [Lentisphaeria bacterium]|nr:hypothetical protein [Lentisphaeria bacterium]
FCFVPSQVQAWSIEPGKPLVQRFRILVHDGPADAGVAERLYRDWAEPPEVTLVPPGTTKGQQP